MKFELKSEQAVAMMVERLNHLDSCRRFVADFRRSDLPKYIFEKEAQEKHVGLQTRFKGELERYDEELRKNAQNAEITPLSPAMLLVQDIEEMEQAAKIVSSISSAMHYDSKMPYELRSRLDTITGFDDSE